MSDKKDKSTVQLSTREKVKAAAETAKVVAQVAPVVIEVMDMLEDQNKNDNKDGKKPRQQYFTYKYKYGSPEDEQQYQLDIGPSTTWCCFFLGFCCFPFWFLGAVVGSKLQRFSPVERSGFIANVVMCVIFGVAILTVVLNRRKLF
eukprot:TRINITY_DN3773_c1_g1_i2.p2 TRINITY_DN3773_c1_g1~~TRINITY_DN3773_c1_g1_i2.p2  ORF type:complete len:146 (-),score=13.48 TRINITY_DN3773_c1_g1_i2:230-667(-)